VKLRLPRLKRKEAFRLFVAGVEDAPPDRWFGSLDAALRVAARVDEPFRSHTWIIEYQDQAQFGGIPVIRDVVHMRDGVRVEDAGLPPADR
jgi:hypothetical protein